MTQEKNLTKEILSKRQDEQGGYKSCPKKFARIRQSEATVGLSRMP